MTEELSSPGRYPLIIWEVSTTLPKHALADHRYDKETQTHVIRLRPHASTNTRLHELGHAKLGHKGFSSLSEMVEHETEVDDWINSVLGKNRTKSTLWYNVVDQIVSTGLEYGYRPNDLFVYALKEIEKQGYRIDREARSGLWTNIQRRYKEYRKQVRGEV